MNRFVRVLSLAIVHVLVIGGFPTLVRAADNPFKGHYGGIYRGGQPGTLAVVIGPAGQFNATYTRSSDPDYTYSIHGSIDNDGRFAGRVIFRGSDWGLHEGRLTRAKDGKVTGTVYETPNGHIAPWSTYQIEIRLIDAPASAERSMPSTIAKPQSQVLGVVTRNPVIYTIKMTTTFVVPAGNRKIDQLRVYHALPTPRPWSNSTEEYGATKLSFTPMTPKIEHHEETGSNHLLWTVNRRLKPGSVLTFTTTMTVQSVERDFDRAAAKVDWKAYSKPSEDKTAIVNRPIAGAIKPELAAIAGKFKADHSPPEAVLAMCRWIADNIKYDASVPFGSADVDSIMSKKAGHCGHQFTLLEQMAASVGIPIRRVLGLNLYAPDGVTGGLQAVRADYTNIHTWAEVYFPEIGWVEVEPGFGEQAFKVPAHRIQNNRWFQNYAIWMREAGVYKQPAWTAEQGGFRSDYGVKNIIRYAEKKEKNP